MQLFLSKSRGRPLANLCFLCKNGEEFIDLIFFHLAKTKDLMAIVVFFVLHILGDIFHG